MRAAMAEHPLLAPLLRGDRRALAKAITLIESTQPADRIEADALLTQAQPRSGGALRLGISGAPGAGKSTFIEAFGLAAIARGRRVAVLAIDPSSTLSGGSILGDKTRMERLSIEDAAFIRPSPSAGTLGGVAERTREALLLCEAAGYDLVLVETVGVGQSETAAAAMTDLFLLLQLPNAGDDLQAIKRGVMEMADIVVVNKADLDPAAAQRAAMQLGAGMAHRGGAHVISALTGAGIEALWEFVATQARAQRDDGSRDRRRQEQAVAWMWEAIRSGLMTGFANDARIREQLQQITPQVASGQQPPSAAARQLLAIFLET
jgi:LAO/AO transport system kinase